MPPWRILATVQDCFSFSFRVIPWNKHNGTVFLLPSFLPSFICLFIYQSFDAMLIDFRERVRDGKREGEKHQYQQQTLISCLLYAPWLGIKPATQACVLTGNWACNLSVYGTMRQWTEPCWPGPARFILSSFWGYLEDNVGQFLRRNIIHLYLG